MVFYNFLAVFFHANPDENACCTFSGGQVSDQESMKRLKKLMTIMDSMNDKVDLLGHSENI